MVSSSPFMLNFTTLSLLNLFLFCPLNLLKRVLKCCIKTWTSSKTMPPKERPKKIAPAYPIDLADVRSSPGL